LPGRLVATRPESDTRARAIVVDDGFDFLCMAISATLLAESGGNRKSPSYQRYFGTIQPSRLKRPLLGQQLETMRTGPPSLTDAASSPALQQYGNQLTERVIEADTAVAALSESRRKHADFEIGPRKAFVDKLNAARHGFYGRLAELPHKHPERNLPRDFGNRFFLRDERRATPTIAEVEQNILRLRERLQKQEDLLARVLEQEESEMQMREDAELSAAQEALEARGPRPTRPHGCAGQERFQSLSRLVRALRSAAISLSVRTPMRRNKGKGGHQPTTACTNKKACWARKTYFQAG
jgi:hypothetical protein